jgi:hypothetical protein
MQRMVNSMKQMDYSFIELLVAQLRIPLHLDCVLETRGIRFGGLHFGGLHFARHYPRPCAICTGVETLGHQTGGVFIPFSI